MTTPASTGNPESVAVRPATDSDDSFLLELYADSRRPEFAMLPDAQFRMLARMQFEGQRKSYLMTYENLAFEVIEIGNVPVGRRIVSRTDKEIRLVDILLRPEFRGRGVGNRLTRELLDEADRIDLPVRLSVLKTNQGALRFYVRLGFEIIGEDQAYCSMERVPKPSFKTTMFQENFRMLDTVKAKDFADLVNNVFLFKSGERSTQLELVEVEEPPTVPGLERFSVTFLGPREVFFLQGIGDLVHEKLTLEGMFIVAVGQDANGTKYEAIFSRLVEK